MSAVQWGMLSTAGIGRMVASAVQGSVNTRFAAVASRDAAKARGFAAEFGLPLSFGSYQDLLACPEVDAVYVPLPVSMHTEWTVRALNAGKHVLCEKPFAMTAADAGRCFDVAEAANRLVIEGLMWREHPQTAVAMHLVAEGAVGRLALVRAALSVSAPPGDIRRTSVLGGGAVLDLGCYCISAIRLFGGQPLQVRAVQVPDPAPVRRMRPALGRNADAAGRRPWPVRRRAGSHPSRRAGADRYKGQGCRPRSVAVPHRAPRAAQRR
jgi:xylose dehydrogenase (NAD/NADP)